MISVRIYTVIYRKLSMELAEIEWANPSSHSQNVKVIKFKVFLLLSNMLVNMYLLVDWTLIKTILSLEITIDPTTKVKETARIAISSKQFAGIDRSDRISPLFGWAQGRQDGSFFFFTSLFIDFFIKFKIFFPWYSLISIFLASIFDKNFNFDPKMEAGIRNWRS